MKEWRIEFGNNVIYVEAETEDDAIETAYLEIGYDPGDEVLPYIAYEDEQDD